jgi:acyl-CoA synthetase (AMP-forming)/AMP-acid ligase II
MRYLVQHLVDAGADRHPDRIALTCPASGAMTYARLVELSNGLSLALRRAGVTRQSRVVVCLKRSAAYIVAMLGALKADAVFVPLAEKTRAAQEPSGAMESWTPSSLPPPDGSPSP